MGLHEIYLPYGNAALLCMRLMVAAVFASSGWNDLKDPEGRSKDLGLPKGFTVFLGVAEVAGGLGVASGVLASWAAAGLILIMFGAIHRKMFVWKTGFWGKGSQGWHYDVLMIVMLFVVLTIGPGRLVLFQF